MNQQVPPNQNLNQSTNQYRNYQATNQPPAPPKKSNLGKIFVIIFVVLIILGAGGYFIYKYYFVKNVSNSNSNSTPVSSQPTIATIAGTTEKMTVELPTGFTAITGEQSNNEAYKDEPITIIYKNKEDLDNSRMFALVFMGENEDNDYQKSFDKYKAIFEKINAKTGKNQISEVNINNFKLLKNDGDISETHKMTEYYVFTNKSTFVINRTSPINEPSYAEEDLQKIVNSFKVLPK